jgi:hypothetical protein
LTPVPGAGYGRLMTSQDEWVVVEDVVDGEHSRYKVQASLWNSGWKQACPEAVCVFSGTSDECFYWCLANPKSEGRPGEPERPTT